MEEEKTREELNPGTDSDNNEEHYTKRNHPMRRKEDKGGLKGRFESAQAFKAQGTAAFLVLAAALIFYYILHSLPFFARILRRFIRAITTAIVGFVIAFLLNPVVGFFERSFQKIGRKKKATGKNTADDKEMNPGGKARNYAILVTVVIALSLITLLFAAIIPEFISSIGTLADNLPTYGQYLEEFLQRLVSRNKTLEGLLGPYVSDLPTGITELLGPRLDEILNYGTQFVNESVVWVARFTFNLLIGMIFSVYLLKDKEYLIGMGKKILFAILPKKTAKNAVQIFHKANGIFATAILGKILDSAIIGMLCFIGTSILGCFFEGIAEYKVLASIIVGVTNVIPFFGPFIGGVPSAILIFCVKPLHGLIFALFILVLQQFDGNYLDPHIVGKKVGLKPIFVLFACMLFSNLWGLIGMLLAVPTFALFYSILKSYLEVRLENKKLPKDTQSYMTIPGAVIARAGEPGGVDATKLLEKEVSDNAPADEKPEEDVKPVIDDRIDNNIKNV